MDALERILPIPARATRNARSGHNDGLLLSPDGSPPVQQIRARSGATAARAARAPRDCAPPSLPVRTEPEQGHVVEGWIDNTSHCRCSDLDDEQLGEELDGGAE